MLYKASTSFCTNNMNVFQYSVLYMSAVKCVDCYSVMLPILVMPQ